MNWYRDRSGFFNDESSPKTRFRKIRENIMLLFV